MAKYLIDLKAELTGDTTPNKEQVAQAVREAVLLGSYDVTPYTYSLRVELEDYVDDFQNPRKWDNGSVMVCFHRRYTLGDSETEYRVEDYEDWDELEAAIVEGDNPDVILPLSLYDHSGITLSVGRSKGWDSGQVGFIYAKAQEGETKEDLEVRLRYEVELYDKYLRGEIYVYTITDSLGKVLDSCSGFFSEEDARTEGERELSTY